MGKSPFAIISLILAALSAGCAGAPKPSNGPTPAASAATSNAPAFAPSQGGPAAPAPPVPNDANAAAMQEMMGELQQLGALDPATQDRLMSDLKNTDPALWPVLMQQFRAAAAYRRRAEQGGAQVAGPVEVPPNQPYANQVDPRYPYPSNDPSRGFLPPESPSSLPSRVNRLPAANSHLEAPRFAPPGEYPRTGQAPLMPGMVDRRNAGGGVVGVSYEENVDWQTELTRTIEALQRQVVKEPKTAEEIAAHSRLRMLYMLAGRREDALKPIPGVEADTQEFLSKQIYGLDVWLDSQRSKDPTVRAAEARQVLGEALVRLGASAPLVVRNLAFCRAVQSYGCITEFKETEFAPDQEVLLYAEVENFSSESTDKGYHTSLRSSYQIFDSRGQRVADHDFTTTEEYCDRERRDFFIGYHLRLPKRIYPGVHTLKLTVEDLKSNKVGQASIEFTVK